MEKYAINAYNAYADAMGWKDNKGMRMQQWDSLTPAEQSGWKNAVHSIAEQAFENPTELKLETDQHIMTLKTSL